MKVAETAYGQGADAAGSALGLEKHASKLRQLYRLVEESPGMFRAFLGRMHLNDMQVDPFLNRVQVTTPLPARFAEMGLGKKMYGEVMRRMPEQTLVSDSMVSNAARRVWRGMDGRPGYTLRETMDYRPEAKTPLFTASLPPAAAHPSAPVPGAFTPSRAMPNSAEEIVQLAVRRAADRPLTSVRPKVRTYENKPGAYIQARGTPGQMPASPDVIVVPGLK